MYILYTRDSSFFKQYSNLVVEFMKFQRCRKRRKDEKPHSNTYPTPRSLMQPSPNGIPIVQNPEKPPAVMSVTRTPHPLNRLLYEKLAVIASKAWNRKSRPFPKSSLITDGAIDVVVLSFISDWRATV